MKRVGVIVNPKRPHAADVFDRLARKADELNWTLFADEASAEHLSSARVIPFDEFASTVEVLLAMGGDGTVLFCAKLLEGAAVPILGINLGSLGFLTSVGEDQLENVLDAMETGRCTSAKRMVANCRTPSGKTYRMLNDAVIGFGGSSHMVTLNLTVDNKPIGSFACDGLIVSTPAGSTGHALSTGGPILQPGTEVFGINLICPHTLSNRPLVIPGSSAIEVFVQKAYKALILSVDGQDVEEVSAGGTVHISRSDKPATFLYPPDYCYFDVLRQKLHWRGSNL